VLDPELYGRIRLIAKESFHLESPREVNGDLVRAKANSFGSIWRAFIDTVMKSSFLVATEVSSDMPTWLEHTRERSALRPFGTRGHWAHGGGGLRIGSLHLGRRPMWCKNGRIVMT
jgi:hypothetical protein